MAEKYQTDKNDGEEIVLVTRARQYGRKSSMTPAQKNEVVRMYNSGKPVAEIAEMMHVSSPAIYYLLSQRRKMAEKLEAQGK